MMSELNLRRIAAFMIDYYIYCALVYLAGVFGMVSFLSSGSIMTMNFFEVFKVMKFFYGLAIVALALYFLLLDCCPRLDLGKRLTKIEIVCRDQKMTFFTMLGHAVLKVVFGAVWPISLVYYFVRKRMIYDGLLKLSVVDKKD